MNVFKTLLLVVLASAFFSCGSDDDCAPIDWVGTYDLDVTSTSCIDENVELSEQFVVTLGSTSNTIVLDGTEVEVEGCSFEFSDPFFGLTLSGELDGDELKFSGLGCTGTYIRQ